MNHRSLRYVITLLSILFFSIIPNFSKAQAILPPNIVWQKSIGGADVDEASNIQQTTDGGYIVVGSSASNDGDVTNNKDGYHYWIAKLDSSGNILWQKAFGGNAWENGAFVQQTLDGGYVVVGSSYSNQGDMSGNNGGWDYWVIKLDSAGNIQWDKSIGSKGDDIASCIKQTNDGGFVVVGSSTSNNGIVYNHHGDSLHFDFWALKLDMYGNFQWQQSLGGKGDDRASSVSLTMDGGYVIVGNSNSSDGDVTGNHGGNDCWVVKLDSVGTLKWQKSIGGSGEDEGQSIIQAIDGSYIITGTTTSNDGDVNGNHGGNDLWAIKLDTVGNLLWQKCMGGSRGDWGYNVQQTKDGGYVFAGQSNSLDGDVTGHKRFDDGWITKLDALGNLSWQKNIGGSNYDGLRSIQQTQDGGLIVAGYSTSNDSDLTSNHGAADYWIAKLSPLRDTSLPLKLLTFNGSLTENTVYLNWTTAAESNTSHFTIERATPKEYVAIGEVKAVGNGNNSYTFIDKSPSEGMNEYRLKMVDIDGLYTYSKTVEILFHSKAFACDIFPNPVKDVLNVSILDNEDKKVFVNITNALGERLYEKSLSLIAGNNHFIIPTAQFPKGNYFFNLNGTLSKKFEKR